MASNRHDRNCEPCMFISLKLVPAEFHCEDCLERYCETCALDHAKFRVLRNHHVGPLQASSHRDNGYLNALPSLSGHEEEQMNRAYYNDEAGNDTNCYGKSGLGAGLLCHEDRLDRLSIHSYEDMENPENIESAPNIYKETDTKMTKQRGLTNQSAVDRGAKTFNVAVKETELTKRVKQSGNIDLPESVTKLTIDNSGLALSDETKTLVTCGFSIIRRYGVKDSHISIELGRGFIYGDGYLKIWHDPAFDLYNAMKEAINKRQR